MHDDLKALFENIDVVKVIHEGRNDIRWLEKDLVIYVVYLFETAIAGKVLFDQNSLLSLLSFLKEYCSLDIKNGDKNRLQNADWRLRPHPAEFCRYAQMDTHYLIQIYDQLR